MLAKPKYKIARRLGAFLFEKTQTPKYAARMARRVKRVEDSRPRARTGFAIQLLEKQKARILYGIGERQFLKYAKTALGKKNVSPSELLLNFLESRLDNAVYRMGIAPTRRAARQLVSHRHITVNGKVTNIPSYKVEIGDVIGIRQGSTKLALFSSLAERLKQTNTSSWLIVNSSTLEGRVNSFPKPAEQVPIFDAEAVLDFYRR